MQHGSLFNSLMDGKRTKEPEVGDGATIVLWSDRHAATITEVVRFKSGARKGQIRSVTVQEDRAIRTDKLGMSDSQTYTYERNPNGRITSFKVDSRGRFKGVLLGHREEYYDFSF